MWKFVNQAACLIAVEKEYEKGVTAASLLWTRASGSAFSPVPHARLRHMKRIDSVPSSALESA